MERDRVLAFRLARSGLADRVGRTLGDAASCPASDFARDAALVALAARADRLSRAEFEGAVDGGQVVLAHVIRGAIHALAPADLALYGRALLTADDDDLAAQLGRQVKRLCVGHRIPPSGALAEVAQATRDALAKGRRLGKNDLHEAYRQRVRPELMPWCRSCKSHHVAPMLWRFATVKAGVRLDSRRRYLLARPGRAPIAAEAVRRFLRFYGPSDASAFADWAGLAKRHARELWGELEGELEEIRLDGARAWFLSEDAAELGSPPPASGMRLLPPGDPYLQRPNRRLLFPDAALSRRVFRPVASPGAVLNDGRVVGLWWMRVKGPTATLDVERLGRFSRSALGEEGERVAGLRGAARLDLKVR